MSSESYIKKFAITKEDYKKLKELPLEEGEQLQAAISLAYNANGEALVHKYLKETEWIDEALADDKNIDFFETEVLNNPYRLHIWINEYPPHFDFYAKTIFSKKFGYAELNMRWRRIMGLVCKNLYNQGAISFTGPVYIAYKFHFPKEKMDVDNYTVRCINNCFRDSNIIKDDRHFLMSNIICGQLDTEKSGIEITVIDKENIPFLLQA